MKHHGQYETIENMDDFMILLGAHYENSDEVKSFFHSEVRRTKQKYGNGKRHLEKRKIGNLKLKRRK